MSIACGKFFERRAYCKCNLGLLVDGRLQSGMHYIRSIIVRLSLADDITLRIVPGSGELRFTLELDPALERHLEVSCADSGGFQELLESMSGSGNLVARAAHAVLSGRKHLDMEITLRKLVPPQAGLGGGSADAAALLELLLAEGLLEEAEAISIAEELGSDIPALIGDGIRFIYGTGAQQLFLDFDKNAEIISFLNLPVIVVKPPLGMATPEAYSLLGFKKELSPRSQQFFLDSRSSYFDGQIPSNDVLGHTMAWLGSLGVSGARLFGAADSAADVLTLLGLEDTGGGPISKPAVETGGPLLFNEFERPVCARHGAVAEAFRLLEKAGSRHVMLSGSGSALIGIFSDESCANRAIEELLPLASEGWFVREARFLGI